MPSRPTPFDARLRAVPSKSATHRALVVAALASGTSRILGPLDAEDTRATRNGLTAMGVPITTDGDAWIVEGVGTALPGGGTIWSGASGTTLRLLTAVAALGGRPSRLTGVPRLAERPLDELLAAIRRLGGQARRPTSPHDGIVEAGGRYPTGGAVEIPSHRSSQFGSALLLIAARLPHGLDLTLRPPVVSRPYLQMTARTLQEFGVRVDQPAANRFHVTATDFPGRDWSVEGDHSSASYFLAAAVLVGGRVRVEGLDPRSLQPDARLSRWLVELGVPVRDGADWIEVQGQGSLAAFDVDLEEAPDLAPTVAVLALAAEGVCRLRGVGHLRHKESDRLALLVENLGALGCEAAVDESSLTIRRPVNGPPRDVTIRTEGDHRMAMAFAIAGLRAPGLRVDDPSCVKKSYPGFWQDLQRLTPPGSDGEVD